MKIENIIAKVQILLAAFFTLLRRNSKIIIILSFVFGLILVLFNVYLKQAILSNIDARIKELQDHWIKSGYNIEYSTRTKSLSFFSNNITMHNVTITKQNNTLKIATIKAQCSFLSCALGRVNIKTSKSYEMILNNKHILISFSREPILIIQKQSSKNYVYYNTWNTEIIDMKSSKIISVIDKFKLVVSEISKNNSRQYFDILLTIESKNIGNIEHYLENPKSIFIDPGNLSFTFHTKGYFKQIANEIPSDFDINVEKFYLKTSSFNIDSTISLISHDNWKDFHVNGDLNLYKYKDMLDYIGTIGLNLSNNKAVHKILIKKIPLIAHNIIPKITGNYNESAKIHISTNNGIIKLNNIPINEL